MSALAGVFGAPNPELEPTPPGAAQLSPLVPGSLALEDVAPGSLASIVMAAPPGTVERQYALALCMRALVPGAPFIAMAPRDKGGNRIGKELESFGCTVEASSGRHQRLCRTVRPITLREDAVAAATTAGGQRFIDAIGYWTQPGVFSWDRIDTGTALLLSVLPTLTGRGADLGCGIGVIARTVLAHTGVTHLDLVDTDRRAVAAARRNIEDPRAAFHWADVRRSMLTGLDFIVMNPPFHDGGQEDRALGQAFVQQSHRMVRAGGAVWLVANRHLPYETLLGENFAAVTPRAEQNGFKVYEAIK